MHIPFAFSLGSGVGTFYIGQPVQAVRKELQAISLYPSVSWLIRPPFLVEDAMRFCSVVLGRLAELARLE